MEEESIRVLVVDDDPDSREVFAELLTERFEVTTASAGPEGLTAFAEKKPHVVITDQTLPGMEGTQLARKIKELEPEAHVVLLTGHSWVEGTEACDAVLQKPVEPERIFALVVELCRHQR
ncbi:MAG: response regulator [Myxococcales bacterium]|nr:response regulator [Myxococcales bacterium]